MKILLGTTHAISGITLDNTSLEFDNTAIIPLNDLLTGYLQGRLVKLDLLEIFDTTDTPDNVIIAIKALHIVNLGCLYQFNPEKLVRLIGYAALNDLNKQLKSIGAFDLALGHALIGNCCVPQLPGWGTLTAPARYWLLSRRIFSLAGANKLMTGNDAFTDNPIIKPVFNWDTGQFEGNANETDWRHDLCTAPYDLVPEDIFDDIRRAIRFEAKKPE